MAHPDEGAFFINQEGARNCILIGSLHPGYGHEALRRVRAGDGIQGHPVGHFITHLLDKRGGQQRVFFPDILANDNQTLVLEFILNLIEVWNRSAAGRTPGCPKLNEIGCARFELGHGIALDPF